MADGGEEHKLGQVVLTTPQLFDIKPKTAPRLGAVFVQDLSKLLLFSFRNPSSNGPWTQSTTVEVEISQHNEGVLASKFVHEAREFSQPLGVRRRGTISKWRPRCPPKGTGRLQRP